MEAMREMWTDERLDDMNARMADGFKRNDDDHREMRAEFAGFRSDTSAEFSSVRSEMKSEFAAVRSEMRREFSAVRSEMRQEFSAVRKEMSTRFDATQHLIIQVAAGLFGTMLIGFISLVVTMILTQG